MWYNNLVMKKDEFKQGIIDGFPIALGYFAVSFAFGMMAVKGGMSAALAGFLSLTNVTSAGQFAALAIIFSNGPLVEMALTELVINLRYMLMSFSLSQKLDSKEAFFHRFLIAFGVTDEIFGITSQRPGQASVYYMYGAMSVAIPGWVLGTVVGGVSGEVLPHMFLSALGVAIYGMFLAIIIPPAKENKAVMAVVIAAFAIATVFRYVPAFKNLSSGFAVIIITVIVSMAAALMFPVDEEDDHE